jgi:hypothetical protein
MPAPAPATTSLAYDPLKAAFYGRFVNAAYTMYDNIQTTRRRRP